MRCSLPVYLFCSVLSSVIDGNLKMYDVSVIVEGPIYRSWLFPCICCGDTYRQLYARIAVVTF